MNHWLPRKTNRFYHLAMSSVLMKIQRRRMIPSPSTAVSSFPSFSSSARATIISLFRLVKQESESNSDEEHARAETGKESVPKNSSMPNADKKSKSAKRARSKAERKAAIQEKRAKALKFSDSSTSEVLSLIS